MDQTAAIKVMITTDSPDAFGEFNDMLQSSEDITIVGAARSGPEAVNLAPVYQPDIVVLDYDMQHLEGIETARGIMAENPTVMLVVVSSSNDADTIRTAMRAGARDYLIRPLKDDELIETIRWLIREKRDFARMQSFVKKLRRAYETLFFDDQPVPEKVVRMLELKAQENPSDTMTLETLAVAYARNRQWDKLAPIAHVLAGEVIG